MYKEENVKKKEILKEKFIFEKRGTNNRISKSPLNHVTAYFFYHLSAVLFTDYEQCVYADPQGKLLISIAMCVA